MGKACHHCGERADDDTNWLDQFDQVPWVATPEVFFDRYGWHRVVTIRPAKEYL